MTCEDLLQNILFLVMKRLTDFFLNYKPEKSFCLQGGGSASKGVGGGGLPPKGTILGEPRSAVIIT